MVDLQCCVCFQCTAKKDGAGGIRLPDFRLYDKVTNQNIMLHTHTHTHTVKNRAKRKLWRRGDVSPERM